MAAQAGRHGCRAAILGIGTALVIAGSVACGQPVEKASVDEAGTLTPTAATSTSQSEDAPTVEATVSATPIVATPVTTFEGNYMIAGGELWMKPHPAPAIVRALIGDVECAASAPGLLHDSTFLTVTLIIPAASEKQGCGVPGSIVRFEIDGVPAKQSVAWTPGWGVGLVLSTGSEPAVYVGRIRLEDLPVGLGVEAVIEGEVCGHQYGFRGLGPLWGYEVVVYPQEIAPGCGRPGARITIQVVETDERTRVRGVVGVLDSISAEWMPGTRTILPESGVAFMAAPGK